MKTFYSNGKLLLTAEYLVLDGAEGLALPTKFGQSLTVESNETSVLHWQSYDYKKEIWLEANFQYKDNTLCSEIENELTNRLVSILNIAKTLNPKFLQNSLGYSVKTYLDFPNNWGLGTSSTLINNIADWAQVNPFKLLELTFGGSGYDIACASHNTPICYALTPNGPVVHPVSFNPQFAEHIYFVHLNQKQNSREGIARFKAHTLDKPEAIAQINEITSNMMSCSTLSDFNTLIERHEDIIANIIQLHPVKQLLFPDFHGSIKSLGAWGGDFVMVTSKTNPKSYFKQKGYHTILTYKDMIL